MKMDIGNLSHCDMHKPHEGAHTLTHSQAILATLSQSFVRTVGNAATRHWLLLQSCAIPSKETPTSQTTTIPILDFWSGNTLCKPALGQNVPAGFEKQTATYARPVRDAFTWAWKDLILV